MATNIQTNCRLCSRFQGSCLFYLIAIICIFQPGSFHDDSSLSSFFAEAYRVGDYVDATVSTRSALTIDLFMADQPLFGVPRTVHLPRLPQRFSMSFEEGYHSLPYLEAQSLEQLVVTFLYSKSGGGRIHSVTSKAIRLPHNQKFDKKKDIEVVFDWVEEASVDLEAGGAIMFLAAFVVSILFLLQLCIMDHVEDDDHPNRDKRGENYHKGR